MPKSSMASPTPIASGTATYPRSAPQAPAGGFGQLQFQDMWRQTMGLQQTTNPVDETRLAEMAGGQVDRDDQRRPTCRRQAASCRQTSASIQSPSVMMRSLASATGMNWSGGIRPRSGWNQRIGASAPTKAWSPNRTFGLEIGAQVASGDGAAQIRLQYQSLDERGVHCLIVEHAGVAPSCLARYRAVSAFLISSAKSMPSCG